MKVKLLNENAKLPTRSDSGSNGYDLYASEDMFISYGKTEVVSTGISVQLEDEYHERLPVLKIEDRSSMAVKGLRTGAGVVDFSYRGEIKVVIHNFSCKANVSRDKFGNPSPYEWGYQIKKGDKIAQALIYQTSTEKVEEVTELSDSERGSNGFGSSGR